MSDDALRLAAEMRAGLEGVTPGPWRAEKSKRYREDYVRSDYPSVAPEGDDRHRNVVAEMDCREASRDVEHIARCSPENIRLLLDTIDTLRRERDEARGLVVEANNSLFGSQSYFHSANGGAYHKHHLAEAIEKLKEYGRQNYLTVERLKAEIARKDAALGEIIKSDTHLVWTGGAVPEPSHEELGTCAEIARAALQPTETPPAISEDEKMRDFFGGSFMGHPPESTETPATVAGGARSEEEVRGIDWLWYSEDANGQHVTFGRWPKFPGAVRFKRAEIQPTEHDPPTLPQSGAGEPVVKALDADFADYDAGLLNDFGGGNVDWWWDYLRAEIGRANDFWRSQVDAALSPLPPQEPRHDR